MVVVGEVVERDERESMSRKPTTEERAAMKEALKDTEGEEVVLAKIAQMSDSDRAMAERVHAIVVKAAPGLTPRTWYGMPAYAKDGRVIRPETRPNCLNKHVCRPGLLRLRHARAADALSKDRGRP